MKCHTLCIGSGLSSINSSKLPEMARFNSGPASCSVRRPAYKNVKINFCENIVIL